MIVGDLNVAPSENDVWNHKYMSKIVSHTPIEIEAMTALKDAGGFIDLVREAHPEPEKLFSFRWHPFAIEPGVDYSAEPTTLIAFTLEQIADGVMLTVTESGFVRIPLARRAKAFSSNDQGWSIQVRLVAEYLARA